MHQDLKSVLSLPDSDSQETQEWMDALASVLRVEGGTRAHYLVERILDMARRQGVAIPVEIDTPYVNTIAPGQETAPPGNQEYEARLRNWMRWNAMAMVVKANRIDSSLGGHLSSYASLAHTLEIGFNHFWRAESATHGGDLLYVQGHSSPGVYARAFLEGRLSEAQLVNYRREADGEGLSSYPHPKLMPGFWQFPTVSMGLGPLMAIYQARFLRYLDARGLADTAERKVWVFCGDGEMDEPESLGAIGLAGREKLDNLVLVVNANLQRLDGPVRGNGKIIQELERNFRGAGWNVVKVVWGSGWDALLARDSEGILRSVMMETLDGEYQNYRSKDGAYIRAHFFGKHPRLLEMVAHMSDDEIWRLTRGGHDTQKIYSAFKLAQEHKGQPTLLLIKTVKGLGMGKHGEARNNVHQTKKLDEDAVRLLRDNLGIPIPDEQLAALPFYKPDDSAPEMQYLHARRQALGGYLPQRRERADEVLPVPALDAYAAVLGATPEGRAISSTTTFVRSLNVLLRDAALSERIVPILVDESRTFGMEGLFRQIGIYNPQGQLYEPADRDQVMYYREDKRGQVLQEGINEAGGMASWIAAATSYSTNNRIMLPFYVFYSMFGMQRIGDLIWAAADMRARGFLIAGIAGRTTMNGEGLQHEDGHSHVIAASIPTCIPYDPTFGHEVAVIVQDGTRRMVAEQEDVFYYITVMNENYPHPGLTPGQEEGILKGMYLLSQGGPGTLRVQLMGSGTILRESISAAELLRDDWGVQADIWSAPSLTLLARDGQDVERWNLVNPQGPQRQAYVTSLLQDTSGPIIAATDYMRIFAEQVRAYMPAGRSFKVLGTDGFGRSDSRQRLRSFFEVDRYYVTVAALRALADEGRIGVDIVQAAIAKYGIDTGKRSPMQD
ncbi:pyruvate dehydrogenase (acetyl-transferring), homodimeric type [Massilia sp. HP4]|uniref:pyruvate dehydrogenase (acetyl-transferring), homodimeric type n=1 Tax=Massilia sp. HP4 TaxID=2562316 RepID=UPI0010C05D41|nr:pyruvate dehydrogenase (acetyl-transferring), homodimeric type [Massilia sp. HP4]